MRWAPGRERQTPSVPRTFMRAPNCRSLRTFAQPFMRRAALLMVATFAGELHLLHRRGRLFLSRNPRSIGCSRHTMITSPVLSSSSGRPTLLRTRQRRRTRLWQTDFSYLKSSAGAGSICPPSLMTSHATSSPGSCARPCEPRRHRHAPVALAASGWGKSQAPQVLAVAAQDLLCLLPLFLQPNRVNAETPHASSL